MTSIGSTESLNFTEGRVGRLRLNRPKALHALTLAMVQQMTDALLRWQNDPNVRLVLLDHAAGRGFCAGGDVVSIAKAGGDAAQQFFFQEYQLNHLMYTFRKPGVAFMDGVTMGGGVGLACPCRYRVATERTVFAMPETSIGLFPDVGGGRYLSRLRGRVAQYLALTGARLDGGECFALGLATHYIPSEKLEIIKQQLCLEPEKVESILAGAASPVSVAKTLTQFEAIERHFASDVFEDIIESLESDGSDWCKEQSALLASKSPTACKISLRMLIKSSGHLHFADEMKMEYAMMARRCRSHDFSEGVRALLIDKDRQPKWQPSTPELVTPEIVESYFTPLEEDRAWSPLAAMI